MCSGRYGFGISLVRTAFWETVDGTNGLEQIRYGYQNENWRRSAISFTGSRCTRYGICFGAFGNFCWLLSASERSRRWSRRRFLELARICRTGIFEFCSLGWKALEIVGNQRRLFSRHASGDGLDPRLLGVKKGGGWVASAQKFCLSSNSSCPLAGIPQVRRPQTVLRCKTFARMRGKRLVGKCCCIFRHLSSHFRIPTPSLRRGVRYFQVADLSEACPIFQCLVNFNTWTQSPRIISRMDGGGRQASET